jgi:hypothetical protein
MLLVTPTVGGKALIDSSPRLKAHKAPIESNRVTLGPQSGPGSGFLITSILLQEFRERGTWSSRRRAVASGRRPKLLTALRREDRRKSSRARAAWIGSRTRPMRARGRPTTSWRSAPDSSNIESSFDVIRSHAPGVRKQFGLRLPPEPVETSSNCTEQWGDPPVTEMHRGAGGRCSQCADSAQSGN